MYEKLKQLMREAGYAVSEGAEWLAADMQHFVTFSRHVLGATTPHLNHLLAYPEAFPHVTARADALSEGLSIPAASEPAPTPVAEPQPIVDTPTTPPEAEEAPKTDTLSSALDVSASGQSEKQDLNPTEGSEQPSESAADAEQPTEQSTEQQHDEGSTSDEGTEQPTEGSVDQSATEGEQPQE